MGVYACQDSDFSVASGSASPLYLAAKGPRRGSSRSRRSPLGSHLVAPSTTVLGFLLSIAASSSAAGIPPPSESPPPDFLCPQVGSYNSTECDEALAEAAEDFEEGYEEFVDLVAVDDDPFTAESAKSPTDINVLVADKYVEGDDGRWRKVDGYTLYGSTVCSCASQATPTATPQVDDHDDNAQSTPVAIPPSTSTEDITDDTLPQGWSTSTKKDDTTPIILTLSLVLATCIVVFMFTFVTWRRRRSKRRQKDPEKRRRQPKLYGDADADEPDEIKRQRAQQVCWAKATARWKAAIRQSARRRRKRPPAAYKDHEACSLKDALFRQHSETSVATGTDTVDDSAANHQDSAASPSGSRATSPHPSPHQDGGQPSGSHPPAYPTDRDSWPADLSGSRPLQRSDMGDSDSIANHAAEDKVPAVAEEPPDGAEDHLPYSDPSGTAHVATDDKAVLARMARLVSAPPREGESHSDGGELSECYASVPPLEDEFDESILHLEAENAPRDGEVSASPIAGAYSRSSLFAPIRSDQLDVPSYSRDPSPHPPVLPPPPSKALLASSAFYEYPVSFEEDIMGAEPDTGPSAPPFEVEGGAVVPSAPPLEGDADALPSAPALTDTEEEERATAPAPTQSSPGSGRRRSLSSGREARVTHGVGEYVRPRRASLSVPDARDGSPPRYLP